MFWTAFPILSVGTRTFGRNPIHKGTRIDRMANICHTWGQVGALLYRSHWYACSEVSPQGHKTILQGLWHAGCS
jgi:hypothetical protein